MLTSIQTKKPKKNSFDLSHQSKLTTNMGLLTPCYIQDVIPGDSFKVNTSQLVRFSPLLAPSMHRIDFKLDFFYVPYRLVWDEWKDFITGGENGEEMPMYPRVRVNETNISLFNKSSLADYLGLPANVTDNAWTTLNSENPTEISVLPFRAYQLIYHEYFRDQNVGTEYEQYKTSGVLTDQDELNDTLTIRRTNWSKDYYTSALPFLQRGPEVELPLGTITVSDAHYNSGSTSGDYEDVTFKGQNGSPDGQLYSMDGVSPNSINLTGEAEAVTINELRKASALQQWLELMARAGSRYREQIFAMFGERIPDYTVQVPQYLGGGKTPIMISEVLSNYSDSSISTDRPVGDLNGHGVGLGDNLGFTQSFDEHGIILGLCRVVPKSSYVQGLSKFWQKFNKFDHYFPQFANLGEQEVTKSELFLSGNPITDSEVFGYQQRYAEYKYSNDTMAGDFIDNLSFWELSRRFDEAPELNQSFIECNPDDRIFAINMDAEDKIWISLYHNVNALRPMPYFSNPMLT